MTRHLEVSTLPRDRIVPVNCAVRSTTTQLVPEVEILPGSTGLDITGLGITQPGTTQSERYTVIDCILDIGSFSLLVLTVMALCYCLN